MNMSMMDDDRISKMEVEDSNEKDGGSSKKGLSSSIGIA